MAFIVELCRRTNAKLCLVWQDNRTLLVNQTFGSKDRSDLESVVVVVVVFFIRWCTEGIELLAGLHIEKCTLPEFAEKALEDLNRFLGTAKEFRMSEEDEFHKYFEDFINSETRPLLQQVGTPNYFEKDSTRFT